MKALIIKIRDASFFRDPSQSRSKDKVLHSRAVEDDSEGKRFRKILPNGRGYYENRWDIKSRSSVPYYKIPAGKLAVPHVANLLRVLWGDRPVPSVREVHEKYPKDPYFEELAKKVRVKILSPILVEDVIHKDRPYYPEETTTVRKSIGNSWQTSTRSYHLDGKWVSIKGGKLSSDKLRRYIGDDLYEKFLALVKKYGGAKTAQEQVELLNLHKTKKPVIEFCSECVENGRTSVSHFILNKNVNAICYYANPASSPLNMLLVCGAVETVEKFDAVLYVPVSDKDLERVRGASGVASFLEGGLATVNGVEDWTELLEVGTEPTLEVKVCT